MDILYSFHNATEGFICICEVLFQFALHEHKSPPGIMKFHFKKVLCLFCLNVCTFSNAHSRPPHLCGFWGKYITVFILYKNHFVSPSTVIVASSVGSLNVCKGRVFLCLSCRRLCEEVSQVLMLIFSDVPAHLNPQ